MSYISLRRVTVVLTFQSTDDGGDDSSEGGGENEDSGNKDGEGSGSGADEAADEEDDEGISGSHQLNSIGASVIAILGAVALL